MLFRNPNTHSTGEDSGPPPPTIDRGFPLYFVNFSVKAKRIFGK